jgi:hypothetical protein
MVSRIVFLMISSFLLISIANTAFASTPNGFYFGGSVMKFLSISELGGETVNERQSLIEGTGGFSNITIVIDGDAAKLNEVAIAGDFYKVAVPLKNGDLVGDFKDSTGNTVIIDEQSKEIFEVIGIE